MNKDSHVAIVSLKKLSEDTGASTNTIKKCIDHLVDKEYVVIDKSQKCNKYKLLNPEQFEMFSYDFLKNTELSFTEKAYICASQQFMFKDIQGIGKISMSNEKLAEKINTSERSIRRADKSLIDKGLLTLVKNNTALEEYGYCKSNTKIFFLAKMLQTILWKVEDHDSRIEQLEKSNREKDKLIEKLSERVSELEKDKKPNYTYSM